MRCEFSDGLRVSYCGPLRINKKDAINVFLDPEETPPEIQGELLEATLHGNCNEMRKIAREVVSMFGTNLPE
jgi:hypothetical protein